MTCVQSMALTVVVAAAMIACSADESPDESGRPAPTLPPPFAGTIFIDPDIITSSDPTTFQNLSSAGRGARTMFDRRVNGWITVDAFLFNASFDDGLTAEIQVNPEFGESGTAMVEAEKYAAVIGRLPTSLRRDVQTVWIHKGTQPFGGGNNNLLIHVGQADLCGTFISTYARDNPTREDIAESFVPYLAVRYRSNRISQSLAQTILRTIPNRTAYFDNQRFDMHPVK